MVVLVLLAVLGVIGTTMAAPPDDVMLTHPDATEVEEREMDLGFLKGWSKEDILQGLANHGNMTEEDPELT